MFASRLTVKTGTRGGFVRLAAWWRALSSLVASRELMRVVYIDIGSAPNFPLPVLLNTKFGKMELISIDLIDVKPVSKRMYHVRCAVGPTEGVSRLFLTRHPGCTSLRRPSASRLSRWPVR